MQKPLWIVPALFLYASICSPNVRADLITLDISTNLSPADGAKCSASGCTLSGTLVFDNTGGFIVTADVTLSGELPLIVPFTQPIFDPFAPAIEVCGVPCTFEVFVSLPPPTPFTLIGYDGGPVNAIDIKTNSGAVLWFSTGPVALTPVPELGTIGLMLAGIGFLSVMLKRIA